MTKLAMNYLMQNKLFATLPHGKTRDLLKQI